LAKLRRDCNQAGDLAMATEQDADDYFGVHLGGQLATAFAGFEEDCRRRDPRAAIGLASAIWAHLLARELNCTPEAEAFLLGLTGDRGPIPPRAYADEAAGCVATTAARAAVSIAGAGATTGSDRPGSDAAPDRVALAADLGQSLARFSFARDADARDHATKLLHRLSSLGVSSGRLTELIDEAIDRWRGWRDAFQFDLVEPRRFDLVAGRPSAFDGSQVRLRALLVEDERTALALLVPMVERLGFEVVTATDGGAALGLAQSWRPHLVLSDLSMPRMNGIELCRALRANNDGRGVYFLLLTAQEGESSLVHAFDSGVDDYIAKPFKPRELGARIRAGERVIRLQLELAREREELRLVADALAVTNRRLEAAAMTDPLTQCANRRFAMQRLQQEWSAGLRAPRQLAVLMIDIDHFKRFNDNHGHAVGDAILAHAAAVLRRNARAHDLVCRVGGEEFLFICPDSSVAAAGAYAERLRAQIESNTVRVGAQELRLTISVGVAVRQPAMPDVDTLLGVADSGCYAAKAAGRNRVVVIDRDIPAAPHAAAKAGN
jgi:diguanylate cyclase (GGDEF)-like protein